MRKRLSNIYANIYYSFPVQLFILQMKKHHLFLMFWLIYYLIIFQQFGKKFGIPYLLLDPEYQGEVGFWSFFILGASYGSFLMIYNVTYYILNGFRFPFIATLSRPFFKFCVNNSILPALFFIIYCFVVVQFQINSGLQNPYVIFKNIIGFSLGTILVIILVITYFFNTNKDIFKMFGLAFSDEAEKQAKHRKVVMKKNLLWEELKTDEKKWRVDTYLTISKYLIPKLHIVRSTEHYDPEILKSVFKQNHLNAVIIQTFAFIILLSLSFFRDNPFFQIPAGASMFLLFSIIIMITGALSFWLRGWRTAIFITLLFVINYLFSFNFFKAENKAYGLNYDGKKAIYSYETLREQTYLTTYLKDKENTLQIFENWKNKFEINKQKINKPKMVFINVSGGGLRSAVWTMRTLQMVDSALYGRLFNQTFLITGASGGMIAAAYYRELYLQKQHNKIVSCADNKYLNNIANDILNPLIFSIVVNDLFLRLQKVKDGEYEYPKDRGYIFEQQLNKNTDYLFDKRLKDYTYPEKQALIPMLIITPTIINDGRKLYISSQPVSYLIREFTGLEFSKSNLDGIDFYHFFEKQNSQNLKFTSALRMSSTFPYVTPNVTLPSDPQMEVMDAGVRDNFGLETSIRFLYVFRNWIKENTSGVIFVQIRDTRKVLPIEKKSGESIFEKLTNPLSGFYTNWAKFQDYNQDNIIQYATSWLGTELEVVRFQYMPSNINEQASLSWHLTSREKQNILNSIYRYENQKSILRLKELLEE